MRKSVSLGLSRSMFGSVSASTAGSARSGRRRRFPSATTAPPLGAMAPRRVAIRAATAAATA